MISVKKNILLAPLTTFKIGGPAKYFFRAKTIDELIEAIQWAEKKGLAYFILGGGSNILISDKGFTGLAIQFQNSGVEIKGLTIIVSAGLSLSRLIELSVKAGLTGLEWAAGIPGTVGGAVRGNAGAMGQATADYVMSIKVLRNGEVITLKNKEVNFSYRQSVFQQNRDVILEATLVLKKGNLDESKEIIEQCLHRRAAGQPAYPSAGCIFKNPGQVSAGRLIEQCGLKGFQIGGARISKKHANFIVNVDRATAENVIILIGLIKQKVRTKFDIELNEEIKYIGF